jgi:PAS domain S-box-containing protein
MVSYFGRIVAEHLPFDREYRIVRASDGSERWVLGRGTVSYGADGSPLRMIGVIQDITERKVAAAELLSAKNHLQAMIDAIPDLLFEVDLDGRLHDYHARQSELLVARPEAFLGKTLSEVFPPAAAEASMSAIREASLAGWSAGKTYSLQLPNGETWFELSVAAMPVVGSLTHRFIVLARDITTRKQAEVAITQQLDELRRWQEVMFDREDRVGQLKHEVNELARRLGAPVRYPSQEEGSE